MWGRIVWVVLLLAGLLAAEPGPATRYFHINISGPAGTYRLRYKQTTGAKSEEDPGSGGGPKSKRGARGPIPFSCRPWTIWLWR